MRSFLFFALQKKHAPPLGKKSQHCGRLQHSFSFLDGTCSRRNSAGTDTLFGSFFWRTLETKKTTPSSSSFQTKSWESTFRKVVFEKKFFFRVRETTENPSIFQLPYHKSYKNQVVFHLPTLWYNFTKWSLSFHFVHIKPTD